MIPNRGLRARAGTAGPGHFTRRKKKGESPGIGPFAELATPTFFAGPTFFFELSFWPGKAVRDGQGLLAVHAEVKRKVWGSLSGGLGAFWGAQEQKKFNIARFARECFTPTFYLVTRISRWDPPTAARFHEQPG